MSHVRLTNGWDDPKKPWHCTDGHSHGIGIDANDAIANYVAEAIFQALERRKVANEYELVALRAELEAHRARTKLLERDWSDMLQIALKPAAAVPSMSDVRILGVVDTCFEQGYFEVLNDDWIKFARAIVAASQVAGGDGK